ncbi:MAG: hypothetical protein Q7V56_16600 [Gammaproteobacteria bacterium]|nr:hypothetical protein [Gammaproteobacteria bacterium]
MVKNFFENSRVPGLRWKIAMCAMIFASACSINNAADASSPSNANQTPIEFKAMTLEDFNKGRPIDFYFLSYTKEGQESLCEEILSALNVAYAREATISEALYGYLLLQNRLSVSWEQIPYHNPTGLNQYLARYARVDINNDSVIEDVIINTTSISSIPFHRLKVISLGVLPDEIAEVSTDIGLAIRESGGDLRGDEVFNNMEKYLNENFEDYNSTGLSILQPFFEVVNVNNRNYMLLTTRNFINTRIDVFVFSLTIDDSLSGECRNTSYYKIFNR